MLHVAERRSTRPQSQKAEYKAYTEQVQALLEKLKTDEKFDQKLTDAGSRGDRKAVRALLREGGLSTVPISALDLDEDVKIHVKFDWLWEFSIEW